MFKAPFYFVQRFRLTWQRITYYKYKYYKQKIIQLKGFSGVITRMRVKVKL